VVAVAAGTRPALIALGVLGLLAAALLLVLGVSLVLDMTQLTAEVPPESLRAFQVGGWKTFFKLVSTALVLGAIGVAELRASTTKARAESAAFLIHKQS